MRSSVKDSTKKRTHYDHFITLRLRLYGRHLSGYLRKIDSHEFYSPKRVRPKAGTALIKSVPAPRTKYDKPATAPTEKSIFSTVVPRPMPSSSMPCYTATKVFSPPRRDMSASMKPVPSNTRGTKSSSCRRHKENC